jgi:hypothetical protein
LDLSDTKSSLTHAIEESEGTRFLLWWDGQECAYSEDLQSKTRDDAEKEAAETSTVSSPLERTMKALGATPTAPSSLAEPILDSSSVILELHVPDDAYRYDDTLLLRTNFYA